MVSKKVFCFLLIYRSIKPLGFHFLSILQGSYCTPIPSSSFQCPSSGSEVQYAKIQKLYDSAISGLLPERQAQRMIQQYDEEQLMLEKRVEELQGQIQEEEVEKIDTNRFIALVNKYRNCEELTDTICRFYFINYQGGLLNENEPEGNENPVYLWLSEP